MKGSRETERLVLIAQATAWQTAAVLLGILLVLLVPLFIADLIANPLSFIIVVLALGFWLFVLSAARRRFDEARRLDGPDTAAEARTTAATTTTFPRKTR